MLLPLSVRVPALILVSGPDPEMADEIAKGLLLVSIDAAPPKETVWDERELEPLA